MTVLDNFFLPKGNTERNKSAISLEKIMNENNRNENENPIILALLIGQEAVLSL